MTGTQKGSLIGGTWLIAIGSVFLVQQALDLPWPRAWPLFMIMAGIGSGASALIGLAGRRISPLAVAWALVWPLLLVAVGPLLIASYVYNFNNFNLIYLFISGGPPIAGASTQAGHTDILLSYVYKLAFESSGRGVQYGLASAIYIIVFLIVGAITLLQYRFTNMWEEVSENV